MHVSVWGGGEGVGGRAEAVFTSIFQSLQVTMAVWQCSTAHFTSFGVRGLKDICSSTCQAFQSLKNIYGNIPQHISDHLVSGASKLSTAILARLF